MRKLTKEDRRLIAKIAKSLPLMLNTKELVIFRKKRIPKEVNHRKELEKMFLQFGEQGLATYENAIRKQAQ